MSAFPGKPSKAEAVPKPLVGYGVTYDNGNQEVFKAHYIVWGNGFVRMYEEVSDTNHVLVIALNNSIVTHITELTDDN